MFLFPVISLADIDQSIPQFIAETAKIYGIDPQLALYVSFKESGWNPQAIGDEGTSFGLWQIHNPTSKKKMPLTTKQAHDINISTFWAMQTMLDDGGCFQWSTCPINSG